jgi:hypothetical protein
MPQPQESQPDTPQEASLEEEPFEIEFMVPESPMAQGSPAEEQQQLKHQDIEDKANEEYPPPRDIEDEKMYWDVDEVESFRPKLQFSPAGFKLCWSTWASPLLPGIASRKSHVQGGLSSKPSHRFSSDSECSTDTRD